MTAVSSDVLEERIRAAVTERLGATAIITRLKQRNDMVYLEVIAQLSLERTAKAVQQGLDGIGSFLRSHNIEVDVTISSPWQPRAISALHEDAAGTEDAARATVRANRRK